MNIPAPTPVNKPPFEVYLAATAADLRAVQQLRYDVFVTELGGDGRDVDHGAGLERDRFDAFADHLLARCTRTGRVVGTYRMMRAQQAARAGGYYGADEFDLSALLQTGQRLLEVGRSCVHPEYRGGLALHALWNGLARYVGQHRIGLLFGVASFAGTDLEDLAPMLSLLHHRHLAPPALRPRALGGADFTPWPEDRIDRRDAMRRMPALIKAYLRLGGVVGQGVFVDRVFNTTDVCLVLDTARINERQARFYTQAEDVQKGPPA